MSKENCADWSLRMIDFKTEIAKYTPLITVDEVENAIPNEINDIMDLLQYVAGYKAPEPKE
jgi:hypothetical protein